VAARLRELAAAVEDAQAAYRAAVVDALRAGASVREVSRTTGLSTSTIQIWAREHGWPGEGDRTYTFRRRGESVPADELRILRGEDPDA
jgi:transposase